MGVGNAALTNVADDERLRAKRYLESLEKKMREKNVSPDKQPSSISVFI